MSLNLMRQVIRPDEYGYSPELHGIGTYEVKLGREVKTSQSVPTRGSRAIEGIIGGCLKLVFLRPSTV